MKIDRCIVACDEKDTFLKPWELVHTMWKKVCNIEAILIIIGTKIPQYLEHMKDTIILFEPIENMNTIFQAQCIRILYPCLFDNENIIISDADILPLKKSYFVDSIKDFSNDHFITYRDAYIKQQMYGLCYNVANSNTWKKLFKIENITDIKNTLKLWYNKNYNGSKNCDGWYTDQKKLFEIVSSYEKHVILKDKDLNFKRLDKKQRKTISSMNIDMMKRVKNLEFTDFHFIRPYNRFKHAINKISSIVLE